ncbi:MAG: RluA family pseudouridine synthase [Bacilli bacterium]|jgi:23S rRNA pseudouridine955/2504/2580 synthase
MTYTVTENDVNQRIDKFLKRMLKDAPLSFIYKMFRQKDVKVNGVKAKIDYILKEGDVVDIYLKEALLEKFHKEALLRPVTPDFTIIYEDQNVLIVDKPRGLLVHADDEGENRITLQNMVLNYLSKKGEWDPNNLTGFVPASAHRLDRNTSGIVVFGKTLPALQELLNLFRERDQIEKKYTLLVRGITNGTGQIDFPLIKDSELRQVRVGRIERGAKPALTIYKRLKAYQCGFSLVEAELMTGRTHQLRVHFAAIGHPIVGDSKYGDFDVNDTFERMYGFRNQFLHASYFAFKDKVPGVLSYLSGKVFESPLPEKEKQILESLSKIS